MELITTAGALAMVTDAARAGGGRVGLVPTMGALHEGHRSLIARARASCDTVVVSIFVNPLQFGDEDDFARYPRDLDADVAVAAGDGAAYVFAPAVSELYPPPVLTTVHVGGLTEVLEGKSRPGHFDGVATVLTRLFGIVGRCVAYFGEKDYQQLVVVRQMVGELRLPVEVVGCPTVREPDGLALSSRNGRLDAPARAAAPALWRSLQRGAELVAGGEEDPAAVRRAMAETLAAEPAAALDYLEVVEPETLKAPQRIAGPVRLVGAAVFGGVRLIDNLAAAKR